MSARKFFIFSLCLMAFNFAQAQMPQAISYQAVARDAQGKVVSEKPIGVKVEILKGAANGDVVFSETHTPTSSKTGTVNLLIGQGSNVNGTFASIDWGADTYFLQLSMDLAGGTNYEKVSTTQMLPVPYALYAAKAGEVENGGNSGNVEDTPKFTFVVTDIDNTGDDLYRILSGSEVKDAYSSIILEFTALYLDGKDQMLQVSIDGLTPENEKIGQSSCMGRMFYMYYDNVLDGNYKLIVSDKNNNVVKEYPFIFKTVEK